MYLKYDCNIYICIYSLLSRAHFVSISVTLGCLVLNQRYKKRLEDYLLLPENSMVFRRHVFVHILIYLNLVVAVDEGERVEQPNRQVPDTPSDTDIEDLFRTMPNGPRGRQYCDSQFNCNEKSRENCQKLMKVYQSHTVSHLKEFTENMRSMRHTVFLILLLCSMFVVSAKLSAGGK